MSVGVSYQGEEIHGLDLEHLLDSRELDTLLKAASMVAASSVEKEERGEIFKHMGHIADVQEQVSAYRSLALKDEVSRICEIGFNAGHSAILFLSSDKTNKLTSFDSGTLQWSPISAKFVSFLFPNRFSYVTGNSIEIVPEFSSRVEPDERCDLFHIDGDHGMTVPFIDLTNARQASRTGAIVVMDDATESFPGVMLAWNKAKSEGWVREINCTGPVAEVDGFIKGWCIGELL